MAYSFLGKKEDMVWSHVRKRRLGEGHLITNDYGSWAYLSDEEMSMIEKGNLDSHVHSLLKERRILLDDSKIDGFIDDYRTKMDYLFQGASLHIVVPTLRCNMRCIYCHAAAKPMKSVEYDMDEDTARKTVDFIFRSPSRSLIIEFQGGEPLVRFDLVKLMFNYAQELNKVHRKFLQFSLVTNMTLMTDEIFNFIKDNGIGICTSIDGHKMVHNKNRQDFDKTVYWVKRINQVYSINSMLLVTKHSLPYAKEAVREYFRLGINKIWIKPVNNLGFASEVWEKIGIDADEFLGYWKTALSEVVKLNDKRPFMENNTNILLKKILTKDSVNFTDLESPCGAAIGQLAYNYDGKIYTCDEGRFFDIFNIGTVDGDYCKMVRSKECLGIVKASINDNPYCEVCAYKPYCGVCPVCSYGETKNIISKLPNNRCRVYMGMFDHLFDRIINSKEYMELFQDWIINTEKYI